MSAQPSRPRAVLFDLGGTILEERRYDLVAGFCAVMNDRARAAALADAFSMQRAEYHRRHEELPLVSWLLAHEPSLAAEPVRAIEDRIWEAGATLVPTVGIDHVFAKLLSDGVPVAVVSNAAFSSRVLHAELSRHRLAGGVRFVLSSADVGIRKPGRAIFDEALTRLQCAPQETWFVGDRLAEDVAGARAAGLQPILFTARRKPAATENDVPSVDGWIEFLSLYASVRASA